MATITGSLAITLPKPTVFAQSSVDLLNDMVARVVDQVSATSTGYAFVDTDYLSPDESIVSDTILYQLTLVKSVTDVVTATDSSIYLLGKQFVLADEDTGTGGTQSTDTVLILRTLARIQVDQSSVTDGTLTASTIARIIEEGANVSTIESVFLGLTSAPVESMATTDSTIVVMSKAPVVVDAVATTDSIIVCQGYNRSVVDYATATDASQYVKDWSRIVQSFVVIVDEDTRLLTLLRVEAQAVASAETIQTYFQSTSAGSPVDAASVTDSVAVFRDMIREIVDYVSTTDATDFDYTGHRSDVDGAVVFDSPIPMLDMVRSGIDQVTVSDAIAALLVVVFSATDVVSTTDTISYVAGRSLTVADIIQSTDSVIPLRDLVVVVQSEVGSADGNLSAGTFARLLSDTFRTDDYVTILNELTAYRRLVDGVGVADSAIAYFSSIPLVEEGVDELKRRVEVNLPYVPELSEPHSITLSKLGNDALRENDDSISPNV